MKRVFLPLLTLGLISTVALPALGQQANPPKPGSSQAPQQNVYLQQGRKGGNPPEIGAPTEFRGTDSRVKGWKVVIPGNRPLATPAVVDGHLFIGGGFGSNEFYAFDAETGKLLWRHLTGDDGPTAAVVQDGCVAYNTEGCELEVLTTAGKSLWKKWLGDPLMSMPAISQGKVYMAYPDSRGDRRHYLACFNLKNGDVLWKKPIAGEIITAPVIEHDKVYLATLEGTLSCFQQNDGKLVWQDKKNATSSPAVWDGNCYFSRRVEVTDKKNNQDFRQQTERLTARGVGPKEMSKDLRETERLADYLDYAKRIASPNEKLLQSYDNSVGFDRGKGDSKMEQAMANLGQASIAGIWAYQGSRPFIANGHLFCAMGDTLKCVDLKSERIVWRRVIEPKEDKKEAKPSELLDSVLTPPALVNGKVFIGTTFGEVICLSARTGGVIWSVNLGEPIVFQPAVAKGRVYVSTSKGSLYGLTTGDPKDDGWLMWGGNAAHNGLVK